MTQLLKGYYHDVLTDPQGRVQWDSGWRPNRIVQPCNRLLAALMKRQRRVQGILYWAIGEGQKDWDALCPSPPLTSSRLATEIARQRLASKQMVYLGSLGEESKEPTNCLEVRAEFKGEDLVSNGWQPLREFGLFGGDATEEANSGYMIDYVIHPRIDLTPDMTLSRKLRLTFMADAVQRGEALVGLGAALPMIGLGGVGEALAEFGSNLPVSSLDGVGDAYASALGEQGIHSLGDLVKADLLSPVGDIAPVKLREFRAKARLVTRLRVSPASLEPFADYSVSRFLRESPEDLVRPGVTGEQVQQLQETLADLQIALDDAQLQRITLAELASTERQR